MPYYSSRLPGWTTYGKVLPTGSYCPRVSLPYLRDFLRIASILGES
jgi:hypothetical protein